MRFFQLSLLLFLALILVVLFVLRMGKDSLLKGYIADAIFLASDQIVVADSSGGLLHSNDGGRSWTEVAKNEIQVSEFFQDNNGRVWGYYFWPGIHEAGYVSLSYSDDMGRTWTSFEVDRESRENIKLEISPIAFILTESKQAMILSQEGQLWINIATNGSWEETWKKIGVPNPEGEAFSGLEVNDNFYVSTSKNIWLSTDQGQTWNPSGEIGNPSLLTKNDNICWAVVTTGELLKNDCQDNEWIKEKSLASLGVHNIFNFEAKNEKLLLAIESKANEAMGVIVDTKDMTESIVKLKGSQALSTGFTLNNDFWFGAEGLFIYKEGELVQLL
ncbi:MAG TPA: sialidase family protein [Patescibacteria group bacterium]